MSTLALNTSTINRPLSNRAAASSFGTLQIPAVSAVAETQMSAQSRALEISPVAPSKILLLRSRSMRQPALHSNWTGLVRSRR